MSLPDVVKAERYFRRALGLNPKRPTSLYQLAQLSFESQRFLPARSFLQRYQRLGELPAAALLLGVKIEREIGDTRSIAFYSDRLKTQFPDADETRLLMESEQ